MATSPAQSAYREFSKSVTQMKRFIETALSAGELYTYDEVNDFFEPLLDGFEDELTEQELDTDLWREKANSLVLDRVNQIAGKYDLPEEPEPSEPNDEELPEDETPDSILGFPVISAAECLQRQGSVRGQVSLTIGELAEYIRPIPDSVIEGIVLVYDNNGQVAGFTICGLKNTD